MAFIYNSLEWSLKCNSVGDVMAERPSQGFSCICHPGMRNYGLSVWGNEAVLSDQELDEKIREILEEFPNAGFCRVISQLSTAGLRPPQLKIRESMLRVDPQGVALRWLTLTPRRQRNVSGPLALWHIDSHFKLIR